MANDSERWVAAENITRLEAQLKEEKDEPRSRVLRELMDLERDKLRILSSQRPR